MSTDDESVDLAREPAYDSTGRRITEADAEAAAEAIERDDVEVDETRVVYPRRGRPSLSTAGEHSPRVDLRVPQGTKSRLAQCAREQHRSESDIVRAALEEYLAHH